MKKVERTKQVTCNSCNGSGTYKDSYYNGENYQIFTGRTSRCGSCNGSGRVAEVYYEEVCENQTEYDQQMVIYKKELNYNDQCDQSAYNWQAGLNEHYKSRYGDGSSDVQEEKSRRWAAAERLKPKKGW